MLKVFCAILIFCFLRERGNYFDLFAENDYKSYCRRSRVGSGLGSSEPRMERVIGLVDRRITLPGYIGGVKIRDSVFRDTRF